MDKIKETAKSYIPKYIYFSKNRRSIAVIGTRRGGSTLLTQILADSKTRIIDQPLEYFDRGKFNRKVYYKRSKLPFKEYCQFFDLSNTEKTKLILYMNDYEKGKASFLDLNFGMSKNKIVYKFVNGGYITELLKEIGIEPICLLRHPYTQSLSCVRNKWSNYYAPYLKSTYFKENFLNQEKIDKILQIDRRGTLVEKAFLDWYCSNAFLLKNLNKHSIIYYEDIVLNPEKVASYLNNTFDLNVQSAKFNKPSGSSFLSKDGFKDEIKNPEYKFRHLTKPFEDISKGDKKNLQELMNILEIDTYNIHSPLPLKNEKFSN